jgi:hypothetical protein
VTITTYASDKFFRNNSLILARLIQYLELSHAMKHSDIGCVEASFFHWALVFKAVRKHRYSAHLIKVMIEMKYIYPERLRRAIRLNWLCNPTRKPDGFRAIDWLVELMNLYTKVILISLYFDYTIDPLLGRVWKHWFSANISTSLKTIPLD